MNSEIRNPYPGTRPFSQAERKLFFGRDREKLELVSLIAAHPLVVMYAQSGAGKTSLLNAGLIPALEDRDFVILPRARVGNPIPEDTESSQVSNFYTFNTLLSWTADRGNPKPYLSMSLADYLKTQEHPIDREGFPEPIIAIFDPFEQFFTRFPEHWSQRRLFLEQLIEALAIDPLFRVLLVIREEYLARLDSFAEGLKRELQVRYRLDLLRREQAYQAVTRPLQGTGRSFDPGAVQNLVDDLIKIRAQDVSGKLIETAGEYVEPLQLQVVCNNLWSKLPSDTTVISEEHLRTYGNVEQTLGDFYEETIHDAASKKMGKLNPFQRLQTYFTERQIREWFDKDLITSAGERGAVFQSEQNLVGLPEGTVDFLEDRHIIRAESRAGGKLYELTHDRFIGPIQTSNRIWRNRENKIKIPLIGIVLLVILGLIGLWSFNSGRETALLTYRFNVILSTFSEFVEKDTGWKYVRIPVSIQNNTERFAPVQLTVAGSQLYVTQTPTDVNQAVIYPAGLWRITGSALVQTDEISFVGAGPIPPKLRIAGVYTNNAITSYYFQARIPITATPISLVIPGYPGQIPIPQSVTLETPVQATKQLGETFDIPRKATLAVSAIATTRQTENPFNRMAYDRITITITLKNVNSSTDSQVNIQATAINDKDILGASLYDDVIGCAKPPFTIGPTMPTTRTLCAILPYQSTGVRVILIGDANEVYVPGF